MVFEGWLCVLLRVGWFCLFETVGRVSSRLRLLGIFKVRLRIPSEVRTLSRLRGYIFPRRAGGLCMWVIFCAINFKIFLREGKKYSFLTEY